MDIIMNENDIGKPDIESLLKYREELKSKKSNGFIESIKLKKEIRKIDKKISKSNLIIRQSIFHQ